MTQSTFCTVIVQIILVIYGWYNVGGGIRHAAQSWGTLSY